jgi:hypothetical protein
MKWPGDFRFEKFGDVDAKIKDGPSTIECLKPSGHMPVSMFSPHPHLNARQNLQAYRVLTLMYWLAADPPVQ